jgi:nicotinamide mononucleotide transporter
LWITVDAIAIGLFAWRGLNVTAALYALFLVLSLLGLSEWRRKARA